MKISIEYNENEQELFKKCEEMSTNEDDVLGYKCFVAMRCLFETLSQNNVESVLCMIIEELAAKNNVTFRDYVERLVQVSEEITSTMGEYEPIM